MAPTKTGKIIQITGAVLDVRFDGALPSMYNALEVRHGDALVTLEVAQHLGGNIVRCIYMDATEGLIRGMKAVDTGAPISVPVGVEGELVVRTDKWVPHGLFAGYYREGQPLDVPWKDGIYHTGDTVYRDEDGYFWFIGRADDVIKSSGYRIGPFEVESAVLTHPSVLECAITAVPDEEKGQIVKATVVLAKGYTPSAALIKELQNHVKKVTAPYKYPRIIEFTDELPKTISGKIKRAQIRTEGK